MLLEAHDAGHLPGFPDRLGPLQFLRRRLRQPVPAGVRFHHGIALRGLGRDLSALDLAEPLQLGLLLRGHDGSGGAVRAAPAAVREWSRASRPAGRRLRDFLPSSPLPRLGSSRLRSRSVPGKRQRSRDDGRGHYGQAYAGIRGETLTCSYFSPESVGYQGRPASGGGAAGRRAACSAASSAIFRLALGIE